MTVKEWMDEHPDDVCVIMYKDDGRNYIPREKEFDAIVTDVYGSYWAPTVLEIDRPSPIEATNDMESLLNENERLEELMKSQKAYIEELEKLNTSLDKAVKSKDDFIKWLSNEWLSEMNYAIKLEKEKKELIDTCVDNAYKIEFLKEEQMGTLQTMDELFDTIDELQTELRGKDNV